MSLHRILSIGGLCSVFAVVIPSSSVAQDKGTEDLERELRTTYRIVLDELLTGKTPFDSKSPEHMGALEAETKLLTKLFVDPVYRDALPGEKTKTMDALIHRVETDRDRLFNNKNMAEAAAKKFVELFGKNAKAVILDNPERRPHSSLNLMRALAGLAKLGQGELADTLVDILDADLKKDQLPEAERAKNPDNIPNDGVKYYALRGLHDLLLVPAPQGGAPVLTSAQETKVATFLIRFINVGQSFKENTPMEEIEGFRVRRREAVRALAAMTKPGLPDKKAGVAVTLLRVVARNGFTPEPSMEERMAAALGLARQKFEVGYNPDVAAYHLGMFLGEFGSFCNTENLKLKRKVRIPAAHLRDALDAMKTQIPLAIPPLQPDVAKYTGDAIDQCRLVLLAVETSQEGRMELPVANKLATWLAAKKRTNTELFMGVKETAIAAPTKAAPAGK